MGCSRSKHLHEDGARAAAVAAAAAIVAAAGGPELTAAGVPRIPRPSDDFVTDICQFSEIDFAVAGVDGWIHVYDADAPSLLGKFQAHSKAVNRFLCWRDRLLTASGDATIRVYGKEAAMQEEGKKPLPPLCAMQGHQMSVRALDILEASSPSSGSDAKYYANDASPLLITGSRDCSVRLWDLATGAALQQVKILRNVVTAIRRVPGEPHTAVQASEDLVLRLWDARAGLRPAMEARGGPNQIICLDVTDDSRHVIGGTKGFSRENCEVKLFDLRSNMRQVAALPCADQSIEVLHIVGRERCLCASRDGHIRGIALPELEVVAEHGPNSSGGYTAMGVQRRPGTGPVVLAAAAGSDGVELELLEWLDVALQAPPLLLAATS